MKTLWVVGGGDEAVPGIIKAKQMGLHVVVSDYDKSAPGFAHADDAVIASTYNIGETKLAALKYNSNCRSIDGVIALAADVPLTVATIANSLGLPGNSIDTAKLSADKYLMKLKLSNLGIPVPWFKIIDSSDQLKRICKAKGKNFVIKPVDSRGARGVIRLTEEVDIDWAFITAKENSPTGRVILEEFLIGKQFSTEAILTDNYSITLGFSDRNYEYIERFSPYIIENGGEQPTAISEDKKRIVSEVAIAAGRALGVKEGIVKGDMVLSPEGPKVIEIATRLSGGWFSSTQIPLHTGVDFVGSAIRLALGEKIDKEELVPKCSKGVAIRYFFPRSGVVVKLPELERIRQMTGVYEAKLMIQEGSIIKSVSDHTKRVGFVITTGNTKDEAVECAKNAVVEAEKSFVIRRM